MRWFKMAVRRKHVHCKYVKSYKIYSHTILLLKQHNDHQSKVHQVLNNYVYNKRRCQARVTIVLKHAQCFLVPPFQ